MFIKKVNCNNCGEEMDSCEPVCPKCGAENEVFVKNKMPKNIVWMRWEFQLAFLLIGFVGLMLVSTLVVMITQGIISIKYGSESFEEIFLSANVQMTINALTYSIIFVAFAIMLIFTYKKVFPRFKKVQPYLMGIVYGIILISVTIAYNKIVSLFYQTDGNQNEQLLQLMIKGNPILSIIFFGIIGPVVEELTYRVGLFGLSRRINRIASYLITTFVFAFIHFDISSPDIVNELINIPSYLLAGCVLCFAYEQEGLPASIVAHVSNNMLAIVSSIIVNYV